MKFIITNVLSYIKHIVSTFYHNDINKFIILLVQYLKKMLIGTIKKKQIIQFKIAHLQYTINPQCNLKYLIFV